MKAIQRQITIIGDHVADRLEPGTKSGHLAASPTGGKVFELWDPLS